MKRIFYFLAILSFVLLTGCVPQANEEPIEKSNYQLDQIIQSVNDSRLNVPITLNLAAIQNQLNATLPTERTFKDKVNKKGHILGIPYSATLHVETLIRRNGIATMTPISNGLNIKQAFYLRARVTCGGTLCKVLQFRETITADPAFSISATVGIEKNWKPDVNVNISYTWNKVPTIVVVGIPITLQSRVEAALNPEIDKFELKAEQEIANSLKIRENAEKAWRQLHFIETLTQEPDIYIQLVPKKFWFSGFSPNDKNLSTTIGLDASTTAFVITKPAPVEPGALPDLEVTSPENKGFEFNVPIIIYYADISNRFKEALKDPIKIDDGEIKANILVRDIRVYPTGDPLAVYVNLKADTSPNILGTEANIWLTGKIVIDNDAKNIKVEELTFTPKLSNPIANTVAWFLRDSIRAKLQEMLVYDVSEEYASTVEKANAYLNKDVGNGIQLSGSLESLNLSSPILTEQAMVLKLEAKGKLAVNYSGTTIASQP
jgi:Domain of unknown function (DUF4403)